MTTNDKTVDKAPAAKGPQPVAPAGNPTPLPAKDQHGSRAARETIAGSAAPPCVMMLETDNGKFKPCQRPSSWVGVLWGTGMIIGIEIPICDYCKAMANQNGLSLMFNIRVIPVAQQQTGSQAVAATDPVKK